MKIDLDKCEDLKLRPLKSIYIRDSYYGESTGEINNSGVSIGDKADYSTHAYTVEEFFIHEKDHTLCVYLSYVWDGKEHHGYDTLESFRSRM